ncbi:glycoside hydrolase family 13 protein [Nocardioides pocheonensis]|uniref:Alpha-glucosidase n=1 Tax=Nocardioides pocheonensis TaxID=661485 RepID=A0A3N0GQR2_9ACTN|nr:alpha-glucosidase [Nocardioides pocheonensis]RNM14785.1 alpha-glucosidase [Nocardioides pocheonensis]
MTETEWWRSAVVYQIYPRSFADSNGDGVGDLDGIRGHLDHLATLGVDVVWLSPVYRSPMDDNGYDISDYQNIDPLFGSLADLDALVDEVHARGMKLVMDLVVNHTSDEHPWFTESRSSKDNPKRDWYWWRPARDGTVPGEPGSEPNNWGSFFSGSAWEYDETTGEYYLHLFSRKQPDLNWENPEVRQAVYSMMSWWLARGIDGFRMDVINLISKDPALPDGEVRPGEEHGQLGRSVIDGPRVHEFLAEMHREVFAPLDRELLLVGETPGVTIEEARKYTDPASREVDMVFQFDHVQVDRGASKWDVLPFDMRVLRADLVQWQEGLAEVGWNSLYWDNHDQPRAVSRFGDDGECRVESAKLLATILHLQRGTPYLYQGDELGMTNYPFRTIEEFDDIESVNYFHESVRQGEDPDDVLARLRAMSRDNARTPMQWDDSPQAGFTTGTPWLAVNPNHVEINAARQVGVPGSVFEHHRALIALRHEEPAVVHGDFTMLVPDDDQLFAFTRRHEGTEMVVVANFSGKPAELPGVLADRCEGAELVIGDRTSTDLLPWESRVYRRAVS